METQPQPELVDDPLPLPPVARLCLEGLLYSVKSGLIKLEAAQEQYAEYYPGVPFDSEIIHRLPPA